MNKQPTQEELVEAALVYASRYSGPIDSKNLENAIQILKSDWIAIERWESYAATALRVLAEAVNNLKDELKESEERCEDYQIEVRNLRRRDDRMD